VVPGGRGEERDILTSALARELLSSRLVAYLATLNRDGTPHVVGMWFVWDGEALLLPTSRKTRKARNLLQDPRATVTIDDSRGGLDLRGVTIIGRAEIVDAPRSLELNRAIHRKYVTDRGLALDPVRHYLGGDDVTIRLLPERVSAWDLRETPQGRALIDTGEYRALGVEEGGASDSPRITGDRA
jgi:PPOX class probable F420-dependent enzyme